MAPSRPWARVKIGIRDSNLSEKSGKLQCLRSMAVLSNAAVGLAMFCPAIYTHLQIVSALVLGSRAECIFMASTALIYWHSVGPWLSTGRAPTQAKIIHAFI
jgi:hypothetical protein